MIPSSSPLNYFAAFTAGVLISFSPCVYPLIPVILGYIGASASGNRLKGFRLSLIYVSGLAVTYSLLGLIAALTGNFFGKVSIHPLSRIIVGIIFILFGLSLWGVFAFKTIPFRPRFQFKKGSIWQTFLLGLSSGIVVAPCTSPVLAAILTFVATKRNLVYGATLLLAFAYGIGFVLILAGTFSSILLNLPKSGIWLERIKKVCAAILVIVGVYYILTVVL